jgi:hypothetical protein
LNSGPQNSQNSKKLKKFNYNNNYFNINFFPENSYALKNSLEIDKNIKFPNDSDYSNDLEIVKEDEFSILFPVDKYINRYDHYKSKVEKINKSDLYLKIAVWNCQSLNKIYKQRKVKLNFLQNIINNNRIDIVYLIDVKNSDFHLGFNGYKIYSDNRNILLVNNSIIDEFVIDIANSIIYNLDLGLVFTYIIPNCKNQTQIDLINKYIKIGKAVFADFNINTNRKLFKNNIFEFFGEDSLQTGLMGQKPKKFFSLSAPSDHYLIFFILKVNCSYNFPLRIKEISVENSKEQVKKLLNGIDCDCRPVIKITNYRKVFNDGENILDHMLNDYIENNVKKIFSKYNYLWKYSKREPFLGTKAPKNVIDTFKPHLKNNEFKKYEDCMIDKENSIINIDKFKCKVTKSCAITNEYFSLSSITRAIKEFFDDKKAELSKNNKDNSMFDNDTLVNIIKLINKHKDFLIANTFFLIKNPKLENFADVRMIVIIPTLIKIYENLIYDDVVNYLSNIINSETQYQFGGVVHGSCYEAIFSLRNNFIDLHGKGVVAMDMAKGYDTVSLVILRREINSIKNDRIKTLLLNWCTMVYNMNLKMNNVIVKRTRGIPMGLSLSPIVFTYYVHRCLLPFKDSFSRFTMYIDDLSIILPDHVMAKDSFKFIGDIIAAFNSFELVINKNKTMVISNDRDVIKEFQRDFPIVREDKYLGRELAINDDGYLCVDDRFYNSKNFSIRSMPNFNIFGIKRLLFLTALDAKYRYRFMCWSVSDISIRGSIFRTNWYFFKSNNEKFSYMQLIFSIFNVFRVFIDAGQIDALVKDYEKGLDLSSLRNNIIDKLLTGIPCIDEAIKKIKFTIGFINHQKKMLQAKEILNNWFEQLKSIMLEDYVKDKNKEKIRVFNELNRLVKTKYYRNFMIIQNIAFCHQTYNINKQILIYIILESFINNVLSAIYDLKTRSILLVDLPNLNWENWKIIDINIPKDQYDGKKWTEFNDVHNKRLWELLYFLNDLEDLKTRNKQQYNSLNKNMFRILVTLETMVNNNKLNDLVFKELEVLFKMKLISIKDLSDKFFSVVLWEEDCYGDDLLFN